MTELKPVFTQEHLDTIYRNCHLSTFKRHDHLHDGYHNHLNVIHLSVEDVTAFQNGKNIVVLKGVYPNYENYTKAYMLRVRAGVFPDNPVFTGGAFPVELSYFSEFKIGGFAPLRIAPKLVNTYQEINSRFVLTELDMCHHYIIGVTPKDGKFFIDKSKVYGSSKERKFRAFPKDGVTYKYAVDLSDCIPIDKSIGTISYSHIKLFKQFADTVYEFAEEVEKQRVQEEVDANASHIEILLARYRNNEISKEEYLLRSAEILGVAATTSNVEQPSTEG